MHEGWIPTTILKEIPKTMTKPTTKSPLISGYDYGKPTVSR